MGGQHSGELALLSQSVLVLVCGWVGACVRDYGRSRPWVLGPPALARNPSPLTPNPHPTTITNRSTTTPC